MPGLQRRLLQEIKNQLIEERYQKLENLDVSEIFDLNLNDPVGIQVNITNAMRTQEYMTHPKIQNITKIIRD